VTSILPTSKLPTSQMAHQGWKSKHKLKRGQCPSKSDFADAQEA
jgi:hypothetical protein